MTGRTKGRRALEADLYNGLNTTIITNRDLGSVAFCSPHANIPCNPLAEDSNGGVGDGDGERRRDGQRPLTMAQFLCDLLVLINTRALSCCVSCGVVSRRVKRHPGQVAESKSEIKFHWQPQSCWK